MRADDDSLWVDVGPNSKKKTLRIDEAAGTELCLIRMAPGDFHFAPKGTSHQSVSTTNGALILLQIPAY